MLYKSPDLRINGIVFVTITITDLESKFMRQNGANGAVQTANATGFMHILGCSHQCELNLDVLTCV